MITRPCAARRRWPAIAARVAATVGLATALSGCYAGQDYSRLQEPDPYPTDYRVRHPIAIKESVRTVQILVGTRRGGDHGRRYYRHALHGHVFRLFSARRNGGYGR